MGRGIASPTAHNTIIWETATPSCNLAMGLTTEAVVKSCRFCVAWRTMAAGLKDHQLLVMAVPLDAPLNVSQRSFFASTTKHLADATRPAHCVFLVYAVLCQTSRLRFEIPLGCVPTEARVAALELPVSYPA